MFGIKVKRITTNDKYTIEELFEEIKDKPFTAGVPYLAKHGFNTLIVFPPLDKRNQVQIWYVNKNKFQIMKGEEVGVANMVVNRALDDVTDGLTNFGSMIGSAPKKCEKLVDITVEELEALHL